MIIDMDRVKRACRLKHPILRESLAELIGTVTLVFFGNAAIANNLNSGASAVNVPLGYATALALGVYVSGGVSGGHVNPAVTLGMCLTRRCNLNRLVPFILAQFVGGFLGAALTHGLFFDVYQLDPERRSTALRGVFSTYPNLIISTGGAFLDQVMGTALLLFGIMAVSDRRNMNVPKGLLPPAIGLVLFGVITATGSNTGAAVNPARDFAPRLYSYIIGYDTAFEAGDNFFWIPLVACFVGGAVGTYVYFFFIEAHHPPEEGEAQDQTALELEAAPKPPSAPKHGQQNDAYRDDEGYPAGQGYHKNGGYPRAGGYPAAGGYPRDGGYPKDAGYSRDGGYPRGGGYRRNEGYSSDGYM